MKRILFFLSVILFHCIVIEPKNNQLLMFIHAHPSSFTDEEGLNVAYQMLTACVQRAAPILVSENIWQHVVLRRERFLQALQDSESVQSKIIDMYNFTNRMIQKQHGDVHKVNGLLHDDWYKKEYPKLAILESDVLKHLQFDFFCYYVFDYIKGFTAYRLPEGYVLCIPEGMANGLCLQGLDMIKHKDLQKPIFSKKSNDVYQVLQKYICQNKKQSWCFYVTGHGYHKDAEHSEAMIAGMTIEAFKKLLQVLNNQTFTTQLLAYSSCYAAGEYAVVSYQYEDQGVKKDLRLSYPVLMMTLTDAPTYVFGVPSGFKLPPYNLNSNLTSAEIDKHGLQFYFLQNFNKFCECAKSNKCTIMMARSLNPYMRCLSSVCDVAKVENLPLVRHAYQSCFVPLDKSQVMCLTSQSPDHAIVNNKAALLWYVKQYSGIITLTHKLPAFVSMIPASCVHYARGLQARHINFQELIRSSFLSIDDMHEQVIYLFDSMFCLFDIEMLPRRHTIQVSNVMILKAGKWMPVFAQQDAICYVYFEYNQQGYWITFNHDKQIAHVKQLDRMQKDLVYSFKSLLQQECSASDSNLSVQQLLSSHYFDKRKSLQQELLAKCLQEKICKEVN